ncbi:MAG: 2-hydroxyacid dehydrogenase [Kiloniellales bacterium]|nr:2-hydroxyacid dehydrogenase [Kiloniellales bacterium]
MKPEIVMVGPMMPHVVAALDQDFQIHRLWEAPDAGALLGKAAAARGIATTGDLGADAALMDALPKLEIVACYGVGVDAIDLTHAAKRGVTVTNTPDVLTDDVANLAVGLMLDVTRGISAADRFVRRGDWLKGPMPLSRSLVGWRVGILGLGRIGLAIARRAEALGCTICYHGRRRREDLSYPYYEDLAAMARDCRLLVVSCPGGQGTRHLVNAEVLAALGPEGVLINIARGSVVDEPALVSALEAGTLGGAGLDVFEAEPRVPEALFAMENVVLQPHLGSATVETRHAMGDLVVENLRAHFNGKPAPTPVK